MTPDIEKSWSLNTLGERFLMYRLAIEDRRAHARQSLRNANKSVSIREELQHKVKTFLDSIPKDDSIIPSINEVMEEKVLDLADLLSTCRTYVNRERNDEVTFPPQAELASRVTKQLLRIGQSVALVRGKSIVSEDEFQIMKRVALDSLPTNRRLILKALWECRDSAEAISTFQTKIQSVSPSTVKRMLDDLFRLGAVERQVKKEAKPRPGRSSYVFKLSKTFKGYLENIGGL